MTRKKYRSQAGIVLDILEALQSEGPMRPSRLALYANMPYSRLKEVLVRLESQYLVETLEDGRIAITYTGIEALKKLKEARRLLEGLGYKF